MEEEQVKSDAIETDSIDNSQSTDLYDCLAEIEVTLRSNVASYIRPDKFSECLEKVFKIEIEQIDDIESLICDMDSDLRIAYEEMYNIFRDGVLNSYDRYLGVTFTYDDINQRPDFNELYSVYKVLYLDETDFLAKIIAYIIATDKVVGYDLNKSNTLSDIIHDDSVFNLDTIPDILNKMDPGNIDNLKVFGEPSSDDDNNYVSPKVSIEWDILLNYFDKGLNLSGGILYKDLLNKRILFFLDYIKANNILK